MCGLILSLLVLPMVGGCSSCINVTATYEEVWKATTEAVAAEMNAQGGGQAAPPQQWFGQGRIEGVVPDPRLGNAVYYFAEIKPVGATETKPHRICVRVTQDEPPQRGQDAVTTLRRHDLEKIVVRDIEGRLGQLGIADEGLPQP